MTDVTNMCSGDLVKLHISNVLVKLQIVYKQINKAKVAMIYPEAGSMPKTPSAPLCSVEHLFDVINQESMQADVHNDVLYKHPAVVEIASRN
jgi:hypothetical protein